MSGGPLVTLLIVLVATAADAAVLCAKRSGAIVVRETCRRREMPLATDAITPAPPAGPDGEQGDPAAPFPLRIVDLTGQELGPIAVLHSSPTGLVLRVIISHASLDGPVLFLVGSQDFLSGLSGGNFSVFFVSDDCTGLPFIEDEPGFLAGAQVFGSVAYVGTGVLGDVRFHSIEEDKDPCSAGEILTARGTCCSPNIITNNRRTLRVAVGTPLATLGFIPPFRVTPR